MAAGVIYLDIDDEITSAASRIRSTEGRRVAIVLPHGSRVATSRINFRLLSRDALTHEKALSIIANDAATRALAASAGLPVFSSVGEYEASLGSERRDDAPARLPEGAGLAAAAEAARAAEAAQAAAAALAGETARITTTPTSDDTDLERPVQQTLDDMEAAELAAAAAAIGLAPTPRDTAGRASSRDARTADVPVRGGSLTGGVGRAVSRTPLLLGLAALGLALLIGGIGAYLLLPSATIVVTPRSEVVATGTMIITADPSVTEPDTAAKVVPAEVVTVDASATNTFPATGKRVVETKATGSVRFDNLDPTASNTITAGSIVRTSGGIRFATNTSVTIPRADLVPSEGGFRVIAKSATVRVTAVEAGPSGNVDARRITEVPRNENPEFLKVVNPDPTGDGKRDEFPRVAQKDIDAALAALEPALQAAFQARLADPSIASPDATIFPATGVLGVPVPSVDPATLLDQEVPSFDLGLSASGTVTTVDPAPVETVAADLLRGSVDPNHRLVDGSIQVTVEPAVISGDQVSFPASATGTQVAILDADALKTQVMGRPLDEARRALEAYGTVQLSVWPDWVSTIPTLDGRVQLTLDEAVPVETPPPTATP